MQKLLLTFIFCCFISNTFAEPAASVDLSKDVFSDRNVITPSAQTPPKGSLSAYSTDILLVGLCYGITDNTEIVLSSVIPPAFASIMLKHKFCDTSFLRVAAQVSSGYFIFFEGGTLGGSTGIISEYLVFPDLTLGVYGHVLAGRGFFIEDGTEWDQNGTYYYLSGLSANWRIAEKFKLITETYTMNGYENSVWGDQNISLLYGIRYASAKAGIDLCFMKTFVIPGNDYSEGTNVIGLGYPLISISYKF